MEMVDIISYLQNLQLKKFYGKIVIIVENGECKRATQEESIHFPTKKY